MDPNAALSNVRSALLKLREARAQGLTAHNYGVELADAFDALDSFLLNGGDLPSTWQSDSDLRDEMEAYLNEAAKGTMHDSYVERQHWDGLIALAQRRSTFPAGARESGVYNPVEEDVPAPNTHHLFTFAVAIAREKASDWAQDAHNAEMEMRAALAAAGLHVIQLDHHTDPDVLFYDGDASTLPEEWR
jgi:hypothetical protein